MQLDLFDIQKNSETISLEDVFLAYHACRKNKRYRSTSLEFELDYENQLVELWREIKEGSYKPSFSSAFIIKKPVCREIFAAQFRDRIVHHLVIDKLEHHFEKTFIYDSYACRKGRGTLFGIRRIEKFIRSCSLNYQKDCYILKLDVQGFFMNISRALLWEKLSVFINKSYLLPDKEALIFLCKTIVHNDPTLNCILRGDEKHWGLIPNDKSLFTVSKGLGIPIGNLSSQIFANFFMNPFDHYIKHNLRFRYYGRYVDDFVLIHESKQKLIDSISLIRLFLKKELFLDLHPKKIYLQHYSKGVSFLGSMIRPYRVTPGKRIIKNFFQTIDHYSKWDSQITKEDQRRFLCSINSYLGILTHQKCYLLKNKMYARLQGPWKKITYITVGLNKICLKY